MLIATAGHVDHGKTTLLYHLTNIHTAHLPDEKTRELTIDLGFAYLKAAGKPTLGFVDVPGHERFISNMLAGINAIEVGLLVVAADDGLMPQTLEHIHILALLKVRRLIVVLTKSDRVLAPRREEVLAAIKTHLTQYAFTHIDYFTAHPNDPSSYQNILQKLYEIVSETSRQNQQPEHFRLCIDRVFSKHGLGTIITGTILNGAVQVEDSLYFYNKHSQTPIKTRIKQIHAMNTVSITANKGMRVALNLSSIDHKQIERGDWLFSIDQNLSDLIDGDYQGAALTQWQLVNIHHGTQHIQARIGLLDTCDGIVRLHLTKPIFSVIHDVMIIRDAQGINTLGALTILKNDGSKRKARSCEYIESLKQRRDSSIEQIFIKEAHNQPINLEDFSQTTLYKQEALEALIDPADRVLINAKKERWVLSQQKLKYYEETLIKALETFHERYPDQMGVTIERMRRIAFLSVPIAIYIFVKNELLAEQKINALNGFLRLATFEITLTAKEEELWLLTEQFMTSLSDSWVRDIAEHLNLRENDARTLMIQYAKKGRVVAIVKDRYLLNSLSEHYFQFIQTVITKEGVIDVARLRDEFTIGRKLAVQILEYFAQKGVIRRVKNHYVLRDTLYETSNRIIH